MTFFGEGSNRNELFILLGLTLKLEAESYRETSITDYPQTQSHSPRGPAVFTKAVETSVHTTAFVGVYVIL
jgi:hypothetical protein